MTYSEVAELLSNAFRDGYLVGATTVPGWSSTPIAMENERKETDPRWVRMYVRERAAEQRTIGGESNRKVQRECSVYIEVFTPVEGQFVDQPGGVKACTDLACDARAFFECRTIRPAKFRAGHVSQPIKDEKSKGRWYMASVEVPFYFFEVV